MENWKLLMIRQCKKNHVSHRSLRRIYGASLALNLEHVPLHYAIRGLMDILEEFKLVPDVYEFIESIDVERVGRWYRPQSESRTFHEAWIERCISVIRLTEVSAFPGYRRPAWFRNRYPAA